MKGERLCLFVSLLILSLSILVNVPVALPISRTQGFVSGEVIVGLDKFDVEMLRLLELKGGTIDQKLLQLRAVVVKVPSGSENEYIRSLQHVGGVRYAETNALGQLPSFAPEPANCTQSERARQLVPNDPNWFWQWNLQMIQADRAWEIETGNNAVTVALIDSGIDYRHPDLGPNYLDGGSDWINGDDDPWDDFGHGSHLAGIVAAALNNNIGVAGIAQVRILAEKVFDQDGNTDIVAIVNGIEDAISHNADIILMGFTWGPSTLLEDACRLAWDSGALLVAPVGTGDFFLDIIPFFPACYETVIAVSATDLNDLRWDVCNWGSSVELSAPGVDVFSTINNGGYDQQTGACMASAHVAGVAALLLSTDQMLTNQELRSALQMSADDLGDPGNDVFFGWGRVNAFNALNVVPPPPIPQGNGPRTQDLTLCFYNNFPDAFQGLTWGDIDLLAYTGQSVGLPLQGGADFPQDLLNNALGDPFISVAPLAGNDIVGFDFNNNFEIAALPGIQSPMSSLPFRTALARLVNKPDIINQVRGPFAAQIDVPIPPTQAGWWNNAVVGPAFPWMFNPVQAEADLDFNGFIQGVVPNPWFDPVFPGSAEFIRTYPAGWPQNPGQPLDPLQFCVREAEPDKQLAAQLFIWNIRSFGIPVNLEILSRVQFDIQVMENQDFHVCTSEWVVQELPTYLCKLFHNDFWFPNGGNHVTGLNAAGQPNFPQLDADLAQLWLAPDFDAALVACQAAQAQMIANCISVWLYSSTGFVAYSNLLGTANIDGYGMVNDYTFLNAFNPGASTIRVGLVNPDVSFNVLFSDMIHDWLGLERIYSHLLNPAPYNILNNQPWMARDWEVGQWVDPRTGQTNAMVTYWLRNNCFWIEPTTGNPAGQVTADDVEFSIWYNFAFPNSPNWFDVMNVVHTRVINNFAVEVFFDTPSVWAGQLIGTQLPILPNQIWLNNFCGLQEEIVVLDQDFDLNDVLQFTNIPNVMTAQVLLDGTPLTAGADFNILAVNGMHNLIQWLIPVNAGQVLTVQFWSPTALPQGFTPGDLPPQLSLHGCGMYYWRDFIPATPNWPTMLFLRRNPLFFLPTPPLGEVDFVYRWTPGPSPRTGFFTVDIFDLVMVAQAFGTQAIIGVDPGWFPGADLAPRWRPVQAGEIDIFDLVTLVATFGTRWDQTP